MIKTCLVCGRVFVGRANAKMCGDACRRIRHRVLVRDYSDKVKAGRAPELHPTPRLERLTKSEEPLETF